MDYKDKVEVTYEGEVIRTSLAKLTARDWANWIQDQIHGKGKVIVSADKGDSSPQQLFLDLIPQMETAQRIEAYKGIVHCLDSAFEIRDDNSNVPLWGNIPLDELLTLVGGIETKWEGTDCRHQDNYFAENYETITRFLCVVKPAPCFDWSERERDVYYRVLQALCGTKAKLPYEFWSRHLEPSPTVYAGVCFSGASNYSPQEGINLLSHVDWSNKRARERMYTPLFYFYYQHYENAAVMDALEKKKQELPQFTHTIFDEAKTTAYNLIQRDKQGVF